MKCPCGSEQDFEACCAPYLKGEKLPPTAEALMRSRYSAYVKGDVKYLKKTLAPESSTDFDFDSTAKWAKQSTWKGLKILSVEKGTEKDTKGVVEFVATFANADTNEGQALDHHEVAQFRRDGKGQWLFVDGESHTHKEGEGHSHQHVKQETIRRESPKVGRNDPCPCGSGKKHKKCCAA